MVAPAPVLDARPGGLPISAGSARSRESSRAVDSLLLAALVAAVSVVFVLVQRRLAIEADIAYTRISGFPGSSHPGQDAITFSSGRFLAVLVGSMALAALRHRIAALAIFLMVAMTPLAQTVIGALPTDRGAYFRVAPALLGGFWSSSLWRPQLPYLWRAFVVDYGLALLPAIAIVAWSARADSLTPRTTRLAAMLERVRRPSTAEIAGLLASTLVFWLTLHTWELWQALHQYGTSSLRTDVVSFLPFFGLGLVLAHGSRWRFLALASVPVLWSSLWIPYLLIGEFHGPSMTDVHDAFPFVAVVVAGVLWHPVASAVDHRRTRAWVLVVALNALNVADVLFTKAAVHSGQAVEANPFAAWIGPGVKLVGVGAASLLLARFRPRALVWLVLALGAVVAWHLSGLILDA